MIYMISEHVPSLYSLDVVGYCQLQDKFWAALQCFWYSLERWQIFSRSSLWLYDTDRCVLLEHATRTVRWSTVDKRDL